MLASYRVHEISSRDALTPGLSVLRTKVFRSLIACKTFYHQTCAKTSPILLFGHAALPPRIPKQFLRRRRAFFSSSGGVTGSLLIQRTLRIKRQLPLSSALLKGT